MSELLRLVGVTKRFGSLIANDSIDLVLSKGEILGLLGENGAGKTTLMNIIFGHYVADVGHVEIEGRTLPPGSPDAAIKAGIGMVHQHFTLADNLTVIENIILGRESIWSLRQRLEAGRDRLRKLGVQFGLDVNPDDRIGDLTVGQRQRVEILKALYADAKILILDEPTAVLTPQETKSLFSTLRLLIDQGRSAIVISHKLQEVLEVSDRIAVLRRGRLVGQVRSQDANRESLAGMMVGTSVTRPQSVIRKAGDIIVHLYSISTATGKSDLRGASLEIRKNEIVGIAGVAGNGQKALADLLSGTIRATKGEFRMFGNTVHYANPEKMIGKGVGRIPEDRNDEGIVGEMAVWENLVCEDLRREPFARWGFVLNKAPCLSHAQSLIDDYDIRCSGPEAESRLLSGGNLQKLILARGLCRQPGLIIANQPTRGLDEGAIAYVHRQLIEAKDRDAGVLLISEDLEELLSLADRLYVIFDGQLSPVSRTDYSEIGLMMAGQDAVAA